MVKNSKQSHISPPHGLIVGNFCHDLLIQNDAVFTESLGGAASFISTVLDSLSIPYTTVSKVGSDFAYNTIQAPIFVSTAKTTSFRAYFDGKSGGDGRRDRILKRVAACDPITPSDLPNSRFGFGMAVGVGGEILPETVERMVEICDVVFVDIQSLIRVFDEGDGSVDHVGLKDSGFFHLLNRIGFLKASAEEALFMEIDEVRKLCNVVVTNGRDGCKLYFNAGEVKIDPFFANQIDPTGAGDSFLGAFAAGFTQGLALPDAALLGNLFGSMTVGQIGLPHFEVRILQRIKDEVERRKVQSCNRREKQSMDEKPEGHEEFHTALGRARLIPTSQFSQSSEGMLCNNGETKLLVSSENEESVEIQIS